MKFNPFSLFTKSENTEAEPAVKQVKLSLSPMAIEKLESKSQARQPKMMFRLYSSSANPVEHKGNGWTLLYGPWGNTLTIDPSGLKSGESIVYERYGSDGAGYLVNVSKPYKTGTWDRAIGFRIYAPDAYVLIKGGIIYVGVYT